MFIILVLIMMLLQFKIFRHFQAFNEKKYDMKIFGFVKKKFFKGLTISSSVNRLNAVPLSARSLSAAPLKCISMNN